MDEGVHEGRGEGVREPEALLVGADAVGPAVGTEDPGSFDPKVSASGVDDDDFARLVRQAYHVLLTRASRATLLYSTDEETRAYLKEWAGQVEIHGLRPTYGNLPKEARPPHLPKAKRRRNRQRRKGGPDPRLF
ncbi:hypothetical protein [Streptomyces sp. NPDC058613]|uniref:hypothetical protein n=1 Tax=Streptomyces sp. NPDC058613 TaxID=3346556 RepID=UPI003667EBF3